MTNQFQEVEPDFDFFLRHTDEIELEWPRYLEKFLQLLKSGIPQKIMEYGPGTGYMMQRILEDEGMRRFHPQLEVILIEPSPNYQIFLRENLQHFPLKSLTIYGNIADYSGAAGAEGSIDIIMSNHVFYYVEHFREEFRELVKVLKSCGYLITSMALQDHPLIQVYLENWGKWGGVKRRLDPQDILEEFAAYHFNIEREIVPATLEFPDTPENRGALHRFLMVETGEFPPGRLSWFDRFKVGDSILIPMVDQFLTMQKP